MFWIRDLRIQNVVPHRAFGKAGTQERRLPHSDVATPRKRALTSWMWLRSAYSSSA